MPFISIICFSSRADLKVKVPSEVIYVKKLVGTIQKYNQLVISKEDVQKLYQAFQKSMLQDAKVRK